MIFLSHVIFLASPRYFVMYYASITSTKGEILRANNEDCIYVAIDRHPLRHPVGGG